MADGERRPVPRGRVRSARHAFAAAIVASMPLAAAGCKVGPDYEEPPAPTAEAWAARDGDGREGVVLERAPTSEELATWWHQFDDATLRGLVERSFEGNLGLRQAAARILQARAALDVATGELYPQEQALRASAERTQNSRETSAGAFLPRISEELRVGAVVGWEADLWGQLRRAVEASEARLDATVADFDAFVVLLVAEVGATYVELRTFEERLRLARENALLQRDTLELAQVRFEEGAVSVLDVQQAQTIVGQTEALLPQLEAGRRRAHHALAVLLGRPPRDLSVELGEGGVPGVPGRVAAGLPAELLRQRPDVRRAERELAAQSAVIGIAEAEFYPRLTLGGSLGWAAQAGNDLGTTDSLTGSIGAGLDWKLFHYGRLQAGVRAERARYDELLQRYRETVLLAQREVEDALESFVRARERVAALAVSVEAAAGAASTVAEQYRGGAVAYTSVFLSQITLLEQQDALAVAEGERAAAFIAIWRALGGGWQGVEESVRRSREASGG